MEIKTPVVLLVVVETAHLGWFAVAISLDGQISPILCSEAGDLEGYRGLDVEEQVAFLRHRFCGVMQSACDVLWAREKKAKQFAIVFEGQLPEQTGTLTTRIAGHLAEWMLNPPVAVFYSVSPVSMKEPTRLDRLAGQIPPALEDLLHTSLGAVLAARGDWSLWKVVHKKIYSD